MDPQRVRVVLTYDVGGAADELAAFVWIIRRLVEALADDAAPTGVTVRVERES